MARLMSFAKTWKQFADGSKTVTRRAGWLFLKPDDVIEGVEWSPRIGRRWKCRDCGALGGKGLGTDEAHGVCPDGCGGDAYWMLPERGEFRRILSTRREPLGDITAEEVALEGFPGQSPAWFIRMYTDRPFGVQPALLSRLVAAVKEDPAASPKGDFGVITDRLAMLWAERPVNFTRRLEESLQDLDGADVEDYENAATEGWELPEPEWHRMERLLEWYNAPADVAAGAVLADYLEVRQNVVTRIEFEEVADG